MSEIMKFMGTALENLFSKPATKGYPFVPQQYRERTRGHIVVDTDACILCGTCMRRCPSAAITVDRAGKTWAIQRMGCIQCGDCVESCPKKCLHMDAHYFEPGPEKISETFEITTSLPGKPAAAAAAPAAHSTPSAPTHP